MKWQRALAAASGRGVAARVELGGHRHCAWRVDLVPCRSLVAASDSAEQRAVIAMFERRALPGGASMSAQDRFRLTPAEREVLQFPLQGHGAKQIADLRSVKLSTTRTHIAHCSTRLAAAASARCWRGLL